MIGGSIKMGNGRMGLYISGDIDNTSFPVFLSNLSNDFDKLSCGYPEISDFLG